jgi:hypothetical protein
MQIAPTHAVADTSATSVFVVAGTPAKNICMATKPIHISLPNGTKITSTHDRKYFPVHEDGIITWHTLPLLNWMYSYF